MLRYKYLLTGLTVLLLILFFYYGQIGINVGQTAFTTNGDGYKNYYTLAYYVNYDSGTRFTGMNYPYGENVVYTDNQPLLAWTLKALSSVFPAVKSHVRQIIFILIILSVAIAYVVLYFTLTHIKLPDSYAAFLALPIALMSPQIIRLNGHYSLGYSFFFPLLILLLLRFLSSDRWICIAGLTLLLSLFIFIHPYYFAISTLFILCLITVALVTNKNVKPLKLLLPVVVSFALFKWYLLLTDSVTDRTSIPWGFVMSRSTIADILLQPNGFVYKTLCSLINCEKVIFHFEGQAYIGVVTILCLPVVVLSYWLTGLKSLQLTTHLRLLLVAAIPVLLFAMAFPFSINNSTEQWLEYLPAPLLQFRASGRFSWVFYYMATISAAYVIFKIAISVPSTATRVFFLTIVAALWAVDTHYTNQYWANGLSFSKSTVNEVEEAQAVIQKLKENNLTIDSFQAILPIPYFNNGSEKLYITSPMEFKGMKLSYGTGLPLAATMMSRTSISQTFNLVNIFSSGLLHKDIVKDLPSKKRFLVMYSGQANPLEMRLLAKARPLFSVGDVSFHILEVSELYDDLVYKNHYIHTIGPSLHNHGQYISTDSLPTVYLNSFEATPNEHPLAGKGALYGKQFLDKVIFEGSLPNATSIYSYELSCWLYTDKRVPAYPVITYQLRDSTGEIYVDSTLDGKYAMEIYNNWVKVTSSFRLRNASDKVRVTINGIHATLDELMIRPEITTVVTGFANQKFTYNNYPLPND